MEQINLVDDDFAHGDPADQQIRHSLPNTQHSRLMTIVGKICDPFDVLSAFIKAGIRYVYWLLACLLRAVFVIVNNLYCIPTYAIWMAIFSPIYFIKREWYWAIEGRFFHWLLAMVALWSTNGGYQILESGDQIEDYVDKETLVLVNHQSTSDVPLLMAAFNNRPGLLPSLNWIMDGIFKFTNFGIVSALHGDFFIAAGRDRRDQTVQELSAYLKRVYVVRNRKWLVLFPEGGFLRKRKAASQRYAAKVNRPLFEHVTLPRMGAVQAIIDTIGPWANQAAKSPTAVPNNNIEERPGQLKYILDLTIAYPGGKPLDMGAICTGYRAPCKVHLHYRLYPLECIPSDPHLFQEWIFDRYEEKEKILTQYYQTGHFSDLHAGDGDQAVDPRLNLEFYEVHQDLIRTGLLHVFFLASTFFHLSIILYVFWGIVLLF